MLLSCVTTALDTNHSTGYITQLEGEVASKANEVGELKSQNRILSDQNSQLTQLTQTLLRHPAFASFLEDLSHDPSLLASTQALAQASTSALRQPQVVVKQEPVAQQNLHIGMSMIPDSSLDFSMLNLGSRNWAGSNANF